MLNGQFSLNINSIIRLAWVGQSDSLRYLVIIQGPIVQFRVPICCTYFENICCTMPGIWMIYSCSPVCCSDPILRNCNRCTTSPESDVKRSHVTLFRLHMNVIWWTIAILVLVNSLFDQLTSHLSNNSKDYFHAKSMPITSNGWVFNLVSPLDLSKQWANIKSLNSFLCYWALKCKFSGDPS